MAQDIHGLLVSHAVVESDHKAAIAANARAQDGSGEPGRPNDHRHDCGKDRAIALAYIAGGLIPLAPYFFFGSVHTALLASVVVTLFALLVFGYTKGLFTTGKPARSFIQTVIVGGLAASAAFLIAKALA